MAVFLCDIDGCGESSSTRNELEKHKADHNHNVVVDDTIQCRDDDNQIKSSARNRNINDRNHPIPWVDRFKEELVRARRPSPRKDYFRCSLGCARKFQSCRAREAHERDSHTRSWIERGARNPWKTVAVLGGSFLLGRKSVQIREAFGPCRCAIPVARAAATAPRVSRFVSAPHLGYRGMGLGWKSSQYWQTLVRDYPYAATRWAWIILGAAVAFFSYKIFQHIAKKALHGLCGQWWRASGRSADWYHNAHGSAETTSDQDLLRRGAPPVDKYRDDIYD